MHFLTFRSCSFTSFSLSLPRCNWVGCQESSKTKACRIPLYANTRDLEIQRRAAAKPLALIVFRRKEAKQFSELKPAETSRRWTSEEKL